eukprot:31474-Pelagococcus_subviridis.AAC.2
MRTSATGTRRAFLFPRGLVDVHDGEPRGGVDAYRARELPPQARVVSLGLDVRRRGDRGDRAVGSDVDIFPGRVRVDPRLVRVGVGGPQRLVRPTFSRES